MDVIVIVVVGTSIWVFADAFGRDWSRSKVARSPFGWFLASLLLWIVVFPIYLAVRGKAPRKGQQPTAGGREGWYPNPTGPGRRWWDGARWTDWTEP